MKSTSLATHGSYIIDLQKTTELFRNAARICSRNGRAGQDGFCLSDQAQAQEAIAEEGQPAADLFSDQRWLGGLLTNMLTVQKSIKRLKTGADGREGAYGGRPKKDLSASNATANNSTESRRHQRTCRPAGCLSS